MPWPIALADDVADGRGWDVRVGLVVEQLRRPVPGGIGTYARGLLQGLRSLGPAAPDLSLLASRSPGPADPLGGFGLPVVASRLPRALLTPAWDAGLVPALAGIDVVHAVSLALPASRGVPSVACVHDLAWRVLPDAFPARGRRWHEAALARVLHRAVRLVVPSLATAEALREAGARPGAVRVVEEGCDHLAPPDQAGTAATLARLGVEGPYLLSVGTLEPRKNLPALVAAFAVARPRLPELWPLVVVGPHGWPGSGPSWPATLPDGVVLAGPVPPGVLTGLYAGARCLAYVPRLEGFGLPPVEAMAVGTPVVASPMPSTAGQALEVDPCDIEAIADGLVRAASDEATRARLVEQGRARAAELTWAESARAHTEIWRELA